MGMSWNHTYRLITNSVLGNYTKGDTEGNDGILVSENSPLAVGWFAGWRHQGSSNAPVGAAPSTRVRGTWGHGCFGAHVQPSGILFPPNLISMFALQLNKMLCVP